MASSSHTNLEEVDDQNFDQYFDQHFDQTFENLFIHQQPQQEERKRRKKNEFISNEIGKQAMYVYGMTISVKLQHIMQIYSADDLG